MTVRIDHYAPDFLITINGNQEFRHGANLDVIALTISETVDRADSFAITLRVHNPQAARFAGGGTLTWIDDARFDEGNEVAIELGYINHRTLGFLGRITGVDVSFPESGAPTLTVRGFSRFDELHRRHRRRPFDAKTDSGIAQEIASDMGMKPQVEETHTQYSTVSPRGASYASFLHDRAARLNFEVAVKRNTLIFAKPRYLSNTTPDHTLVWGESLRSFSPHLSTANLVNQVEMRASQSSYGGGKEAIRGVTPERIPAKLGQVSGPELAAKLGRCEWLADDQRITSEGEAQLLTLAHYERRAINFITGHGATIGNPDLVARQVIELKGLGARFSGRYYVTATTHTIDSGGYRTEFEAKRDGR